MTSIWDQLIKIVQKDIIVKRQSFRANREYLSYKKCYKMP